MTPAKDIPKAINQLLKAYEKRSASLNDIINFHVQFERIHPFSDYNGRVGRLIMLKECLRYSIDPFILNDHKRGNYNQGIALWDSDPSILLDDVIQAQARMRNDMETFQLLEYYRDPF